MKKLLCILTTLFTLNASAGILVEPYIGYEANALIMDGGMLDSSLAGEDVIFANKGLSIGGRVGFTFGPAFVAADLETGSRELIIDELPDGTPQAVKDFVKDELEGTDTLRNMGITVGVDIPIVPLRFYGRMISSSTLGDLEGSGTAFGLGLTFLPLVDINLEYRNLSYDESDGDKLDKEIEVKGLMLGASIPFNF